MSTNPSNASTELETKIKELDEILRIIGNGLKLLASTSIKITDIVPVQEFVGFLDGLQRNIGQQKVTLQAAMPKEVITPVEEKKEEVKA